jgi:hypothetical protein
MNPCRSLPRATRWLMKPTHDPSTTPFVEKLTDVRRILLDLPEPLNVAYVIGAVAGLRTSRLGGRTSISPPGAYTFGSGSRAPLRTRTPTWRRSSTGCSPFSRPGGSRPAEKGWGIPSMRCDGEKIDKYTPGKYLRATLERLGLARPDLGWYEATRHTFASHWVMAGGSIEKLSKILGHYSVVVTERHVHLRPDLFALRYLGAIPLDPGTLAAAQGTSRGFRPEVGSSYRGSHAGRGPWLQRDPGTELLRKPKCLLRAPATGWSRLQTGNERAP